MSTRSVKSAGQSTKTAGRGTGKTTKTAKKSANGMAKSARTAAGKAAKSARQAVAKSTSATKPVKSAKATKTAVAKPAAAKTAAKVTVKAAKPAPSKAPPQKAAPNKVAPPKPAPFATLSPELAAAAAMIRTASPPMQPAPAAPLVPVRNHKYRVGETVYYTSPSFGRAAATGSFTVVRLLPSDGEEQQYRIKSSGEAFERVAKESQLDRA